MIWITGSQDVREAIDEIYAADDRAAAIVGASLLDTRIEAAIRARLIDDERSELLDGLVGERGPIGAFGTRIRLGFALGIYGPETKRDLLDIAKIRNAFAHEMAIKSFETEMKGVKQRCYDLRLIDRFVYDALTPKDQITWVKGLTVLTEGRDALMANPRQRYITTVALISTALHLALTSHLLTPAEPESMAIRY